MKPFQHIDTKNVINQMKLNNPDYPVFKSFRLIFEKSGKQISEGPKEETPVKKKRGRPKKNRVTKTANCNPDENDQVKYTMWTEKYKPQSCDDIIGNAEAIKKLMAWLNLWKSFSQEVVSKKIRRNSSSTEFDMTNDNSTDRRLPHNTVIIGGPSGSGKTAAVYAVCNQLEFNVIELNASSKRTGK